MFKQTGWKNQGKVLALLLSLAMILACLPQPAAARAEAERAWREDIPSLLSAAPYREGSVIAGFRDVPADELSRLFPEESISVIPLFGAEDTTELVAEVTSSERTTEELLLKLAEIPSVLYAEPDYLAEPAEDGDTPGDSG